MHHYIRWQLLNTFEQLCFAHGLVDFYDSQVAGGTKFYPVFGAVADGGKKAQWPKSKAVCTDSHGEVWRKQWSHKWQGKHLGLPSRNLCFRGSCVQDGHQAALASSSLWARRVSPSNWESLLWKEVTRSCEYTSEVWNDPWGEVLFPCPECTNQQ